MRLPLHVVGVIAIAVAFNLVALRPAQAQSAIGGLGYGIGGPAGYTGFFGSNRALLGHVAGGGELLVSGRVGAAAEGGLLFGSNGVLVVTSANGVVYLVPSRRDRPMSPFVTGGYTHMARGEGAFDGWNIGAGADLWSRARFGLRIEVRDHIRPDPRGAVQYWTLRAGVVFR